MTLSIKALLEEAEGAAKKEEAAEKEEEVEDLREWKDESSEGASIADLIGSDSDDNK